MLQMELCVVKAIGAYLSRTKTWCEGSKSQHLLRFIEPYKEVVSTTVFGSIKKNLSLAGIDIEQLKGHSTWSAST